MRIQEAITGSRRALGGTTTRVQETGSKKERERLGSNFRTSNRETAKRVGTNQSSVSLSSIEMTLLGPGKMTSTLTIKVEITLNSRMTSRDLNEILTEKDQGGPLAEKTTFSLTRAERGEGS